MPRATATHATEMRQRILDGARRAMLEGGYRGTTMPEIAAEAGVSVGLLYRYFSSKEPRGGALGRDHHHRLGGGRRQSRSP
jgi:AcrR family transcriptional regulator